MFTPDLASFELRECADLPKNTLMAPLPFIREIRCLLGNIGIDMVIGTEETVLLSSDVFEAFRSWDAVQDEPQVDTDEDNHWMN
ncbi:hypothetical protein AB1L42_11465 [Thalassoglobus sp. JC818]|uniref:hypothetical protein n=1 Tax=Thalassoglobus sp. JC818 TaxID=3232136 RepID=UPI003458C81D